MEKQPFSIGWYIIASAILWGLAILACALILKSDYMKVQLILGGGGMVKKKVIWMTLEAKIKKEHKDKK